jgi:hypothetical protein
MIISANIILNSLMCSLCGASASEEEQQFHLLAILIIGHSNDVSKCATVG